MGMMVKGEWLVHPPVNEDGAFKRPQSVFRDAVTADGASGFKAEAGRYHLYVSLACPWAHRTLIYRQLKGLEDVISVSVVDHYMGEMGWAFRDGPGCTPDSVNGRDYLHQVYALADGEYTGRCSVPVLWDRERRTIVNNESSEIIRMFNREFDAFGDGGVDFYPAPLRAEIDALNDLIYANINDGVYRCGFARSQAAYEEAFDNLFGALDQLDARLADRRYLCGDAPTEADWRLFPTLLRFDPVYFGHFKCNRQMLRDFAHLPNYLRDLYGLPGVAETCDIDHIKRHYYGSHETINPTGIVPKGPTLDI